MSLYDDSGKFNGIGTSGSTGGGLYDSNGKFNGTNTSNLSAPMASSLLGQDHPTAQKPQSVIGALFNANYQTGGGAIGDYIYNKAPGFKFAANDVLGGAIAPEQAGGGVAGIAKSVFQSTLGSKGVSGVTQVIAKTPMKMANLSEESKNSQMIADIASKATALIQQARTTQDPAQKDRLHKLAEQLVTAIPGLVGARSSLEDQNTTPGQIVGSEVNTALTALTGGTSGVLGDAASGTAKALGAGKVLQYGAGLAGRTAENVALGEGFNTASNMIEGKPLTENAGSAAATSAALSLGGEVLSLAANKVVAPILKSMGRKIELSTIKPTAADFKDGFNVDNIYKYGVDGSLEESATKIDSKFGELQGQLKSKLSQAQPTPIDLVDLFGNVLKNLENDKSKTFGSNTQLQKASDYILGEIEQVSPDGTVDVSQAQNVKRGLGQMGAWEYGKFDPESTARERLSNLFYTELKNKIEQVSPEGVKEINKQMQDLIPIENAITRRIPVAQRNSPFSFGDIGIVLGGPKGWALGIANRLAKSKAFGGGLVRTGEAIQNAGSTGPLNRIGK